MCRVMDGIFSASSYRKREVLGIWMQWRHSHCSGKALRLHLSQHFLRTVPIIIALGPVIFAFLTLVTQRKHSLKRTSTSPVHITVVANDTTLRFSQHSLRTIPIATAPGPPIFAFFFLVTQREGIDRMDINNLTN